MRHLLVAAVVLLSAVSIWAIHRVGLTKHLSVSLHVSQTRQTQIVFGIVSIAGVLLMAFGLWGWMFPAYGVSMPTRWLFGLVLLGFTILAAFPYVLETWRAPVHNIAAWGMAALIPFAMLSTIGWTNVIAVKAIAGFLSAANVLLLGCTLSFATMKRHFLFLQSIFMVNFFILLVLLTYAG